MNDKTDSFETRAADSSPPESASRPRLWPGVAAVAVFWSLAWIIAFFLPGTMDEFTIRFHGAQIFGTLVAVWWLLLSRLPWRQRAAVVAWLAVVTVAAIRWAHPSLTLVGLLVYILPYMATAWALAAAAPWWRARPSWRPWAVCGALAIVGVVTCLLRFDGIYSTMTAQASWRWTATAEEAYLKGRGGTSESAAGRDDVSPADGPQSATLPREAGPGDWPAFRGPAADGTARGETIATDWGAHPPEPVWRRPIGPGWSSFIVVGDYVLTQEQRGENELISCLSADDGHDVWTATEPTRYDNPVSGAGPRGTPTFHEGRVYAFGANGRLRCVDAATGRAVWSRDIRAEAGAELPMYGYCGSPLVADGLVTVIACGPEGKSVVACRAETGETAWVVGEGTKSYATVQREQFDGVPHYLCVSDDGLTAIDPASGTILWRDDWMIADRYRIVQPRKIGENRVLYATGLDVGLRLLEVTRRGGEDATAAGGSDAWQVRQVWTENEFKPYFNDFVLLDGVVYGYDGSLLAAFDLDRKKRLWKRRGYDAGQVLLLEDQKLLLVLTEAGEAALVTADPKNPKESGRFQALQGKTWNHPVVSRGRLYLRNSAEAACYELRKKPLRSGAAPGRGPEAKASGRGLRRNAVSNTLHHRDGFAAT